MAYGIFARMKARAEQAATAGSLRYIGRTNPAPLTYSQTVRRDPMTICHACGTEMSDPDRFCRTCGASVATLVGDLADPRRFDPARASGTTQPGPQDPTSPFYVGPQIPHPMASAAYHTGSLAGKLLHALLRSRPKILWPVMFLLISLFLTAGLTVGKRAFRWAARISHSQRAPVSEQAGVVERPELSRLSFEESVQNALGFRPAGVSRSHYPGVRCHFCDSFV